MKKKIFIAAAVCFSSQLHAQTPDSSTMDEVVVTATKSAIKQSQTGKIVTVISREELEKLSGKTLPQVLNQQAGIVINGALNSPGNPQTIYSRGASAGRTLVLMDGVPVYDPSLINSEFDLNLVLVSDIERIEICRGAQSTLYGSDAVAGVINIITVKKDLSKPVNVKATATAGSYGTYRGNAQVFGKKNGFTYSTRFAILDSKGFSAAHDSSGKAGFDKDEYNGYHANLGLQYQVNEKLAVKSFVQHTQYKAGIDAGLFTDEKDNELKNKMLMTGAGFVFKNKGLTLSGNYQYSETNRNYRNDSTDVPGFTSFATDDYFAKTQFAEMYANIELGKNFSLLQGADYRYGSMNNQYYSLSPFGPYSTSFSDTSVSQSSLYASLFFNSSNKKLNIEAGGRLNVHSRYGSNHTFTVNPSYTLSQHWRVFGSIASAFKAPSLYQLYSSTGNRMLNPETSRNYELGAAYASGGVSARAVYFYRNVKNGLDFDYNSFTYFNFVKQIVRGTELELTLKPNSNFGLQLNYTFIAPTEITQSRKTFADTSYDHLLRRPKHNLNATAGYQYKKAYLSISAKYSGKRYDTGGYMEDDEILNDYFLLGAYAEYKLNKMFRFFADAQNITGKEFFDVRGYNSIPFTINAGLSFSW